jgi:hypothetical protein
MFFVPDVQRISTEHVKKLGENLGRMIGDTGR